MTIRIFVEETKAGPKNPINSNKWKKYFRNILNNIYELYFNLYRVISLKPKHFYELKYNQLYMLELFRIPSQFIDKYYRPKIVEYNNMLNFLLD